MKKLRSALIIIFVVALVVVGIKWGLPYLTEQETIQTSDLQGKTKEIHGAGDFYTGYMYFGSSEFKKRCINNGLNVIFHNEDGGNYPERLEKLDEGEYDFITLPYKTYMEQGADYNYPGVICYVICDSKGADAVLKYPSLKNKNINELNKEGLKIAFIPDSPNHEVIKILVSDFELDYFLKSPDWKLEMNTDKEAYEEAEKHKGDPEFLVTLWDPYVTKAKQELGMEVVFSSENFSNYILDVVVFSKKMVREKEDILTILHNYIGAQNYYKVSDIEERYDLIRDFSELRGSMKKEKIVKEMLGNVKWLSLYENAYLMFGIDPPFGVQMNSSQGLINSYYAWSNVSKYFGENLELSNPSSILNSSFVEELLDMQNGVGMETIERMDFEFLSPEEWENLTEVGTIRVEQIYFSSGSSEISFAAEEIIENVANLLGGQYWNYRFMIAGHSPEGGEEGISISQERADRVRQEFIAYYDFDPDRIYAKGFGNTRPAKKKYNESKRRRKGRAQRVDFIIVE